MAAGAGLLWCGPPGRKVVQITPEEIPVTRQVEMMVAFLGDPGSQGSDPVDADPGSVWSARGLGPHFDLHCSNTLWCLLEINSGSLSSL